MANLFYKVTNERADQFKNSMAQEGVIGFVDGDGFGYLLANGHQYGPTKTQLTSLIGNVAKPTVSSTSTTFKDQDGNEISLAVGADGKLLLSKYTEANWKSINFNNGISTSHNDSTVEYGSSYTLSASINFAYYSNVSYVISPGTETISDRKATIKYFNGVSIVSDTITLTSNSGAFKTDLSYHTKNNSSTGFATSPKTISVTAEPVEVKCEATGSVKGVFSKIAKQEAITVTATLTVQERWIQHNGLISVSTSGTPQDANGEKFYSGTITNGTTHKVDLGSKPTSFIATEGQKCYLAFKKTWGTPSFIGPSGFKDTSWKKIVNNDLSIYHDGDYSVYVFIGTDGNPANMNAAGAGTWKVSFNNN